MAQISARTATFAKWAVIPVALLVSGVAVSQASYSAFSDSTATPSSNWTAGTVRLANDSSSTALFTASNLKPGATGTKCITVTSSGSLASAVKLYATTPDTTLALSSSIDLTIAEGAAGATCASFGTGSNVYTGTLAALGATTGGHTSFASGLGTWAPTGAAAETRAFQITYTLNASAPNSTQGGTASVGFTWEAQNN